MSNMLITIWSDPMILDGIEWNGENALQTIGYASTLGRDVLLATGTLVAVMTKSVLPVNIAGTAADAGEPYMRVTRSVLKAGVVT